MIETTNTNKPKTIAQQDDSGNAKNYLGEHLENLNARIQELERKIEMIDRVVAAMLPEGARVFDVDGQEEVYIPLKR